MARAARLARWLLGALALLACAAAIATAADDAPRVLRVVADDNYPPYIFRDADGRADGYLVDLWRLWERRTGVKVELTATDWAEAQAIFLRGDADVIDTLFRTPARESLYDFTEPYADLPVAIYVHASISGIKDAEALRGFQVGAKAGDACSESLARHGMTQQRQFASYAAIVDAAVAQEIKIFCLDEAPGDYLLYRKGAHRDFRKAFTLYTGQFHQAVRKGDSATLKLVEGGMRAIADDEREALRSKWMGAGLGHSPDTRYLAYGVVALLLAGGVLLIWIRVLRRAVRLRTHELENQRALLHSVVQTIPDLLWLKDPEGRYLMANPVTERFMHLEPGALIGKTDLEVFEPSLAEELRARDREVVAAGGPRVTQERVGQKGAEPRHLETIQTPMHDAEGRLVGVLGIARDVTLIREADDAMREAQRIARLGSYSFDIPGDSWTGNENLREVFGIPVDHPRRVADWLALVHPDDRDGLGEYLQSYVLGQGEDFDLEYRIVRPSDGATRWVHGLGRLSFDGDHKPVRLRGTIQDVTERKQAEEALRASEQKLLAILENVDACIYLKDMDGKYLFANKPVRELWGVAAADIVGSGDEAFFDAQTAAAIHRIDRRVLDDGQIVRAEESITVAATGRAATYLSTKLPLRRADGGIYALCGISTDITDRTQAEAELQKYRRHLEELVAERTDELSVAKERAEAASRAKSTFLANMSHEIRTPMNAILGMAHLVRRESLSPRQTERLAKLEGAAQHLLEIINDVLDLSKIEAGKFVIDVVPISVEQLLGDVAGLLRERAAAKGLQLGVEVRVAPHPVRGDPLRLKQALLNYATNAIKFTERGRIILRVFPIEESKGAVLYRFEVEDSGIGIPAETLERLFSNFEQADNSTTRKYGGTGLGLAITRHLAEMMGGSAGAVSQPGQGSTFWFTARLDKRTVLAVGDDDDARPLTDGEMQARCGGRRVLLVDDDGFNREVVRMLLEEIALFIDMAEDGEQALRCVERQRYDLILMDVQMPRMNGLDATRRLRRLANGAEVPVVAMTANVFAEDREQCFAAGMNDFVAKPVKPDLLFATLARWLDPVDPTTAKETRP